jgi:anti-repressor protein
MNEIAERKLMTTKELAEVLGVDVRTIQRASKELFAPATVESQVINGGVSKVYTEAQATHIKLYLQNHHNLASRQIDSVSTELEENQMIAQAFAILQRRNEELNRKVVEVQKENDKLKPAAAFAYQLCSSQDTIDIGNCAKVLNRKIGRNTLFEFLRNKKVLQSDNIPYQKYIDSGYFRVIESKFVTPTGETRINLKTVVFQKGVAYINKLLNEAVNEN